MLGKVIVYTDGSICDVAMDIAQMEVDSGDARFATEEEAKLYQDWLESHD